jgi:glycosidase
MSRRGKTRRTGAFLLVACGVLLAAAAAWAALAAAGGRAGDPASGGTDEAVPERDANAFYEIFVRAFHDSDGDGIGDLNGITEKLDYLRDMGFSGIWLTPIHPSPSYHGYDVTDYYAIHPDFGTMDDFERLVREAHARNIRIIMDLVANHTSSRHPWFLEAVRDPDSPKRDWYVWADEDTNVNAAGAVGGRAWHPAATGHYLGIFWDGMPDLNPDNPEVREEMIRIARFWLEKGVDGFRLDAAKHLYENFPHESGKPAVAEKNAAWWRAFRAGLEQVKPDVYLVGEVWDAASVIGPFLDGAFDAAFNFDLAGRLVAMAKSGEAADIGHSVARIHEYYGRVSGGSFEDAVFLSNHDQNRVMSQLGGHVGKAKAAAALLLTMPGKPYVYYGEEIGMEGVKPDENLRRPMPWETVEAQAADPDSLLSRYRTLVHWRKMEPALARGAIASYTVDNPRVASYLRLLEDETLLVLVNLSDGTERVRLGEDAAGLAVSLATSPDVRLSGEFAELPPYEAVVLKGKSRQSIKERSR